MNEINLDALEKRIIYAGFSCVGVTETGGGPSWPDYYEQDVRELVDEVKRLRTGLSLIASCTRAHMSARIAEATLAGANLLDEDVAADVCEGNWKPRKESTP